MEMERGYPRVRFSVECLQEALEVLLRLRNDDLGSTYPNEDWSALQMFGTWGAERRTLRVDGDKWSHDTDEEFFQDYRRGPSSFTLSKSTSVYKVNDTSTVYSLEVSMWEQLEPQVTVRAPNRQAVAAVFEVFERHATHDRLPDEPHEQPPPLTVFIGHGTSPEWEKLRDHLRDRQHFKVAAYETGNRAGHVIRDIIDSMLSEANFAVLVMTGDDRTSDGVLRARQNVIHEIGLFQARLGWARAIVLLEDGVEDFSNLQGVHHIKFEKGRIASTFGEVVATLREVGEVR